MPGYEIKIERLAMGSAPDLVIRSLKDRQQFADAGDLAAQAGVSSATWPLFGQVWPSGRVLAEHLAKVEIRGRRVLELGCGLGLASLVMHRRGADVTASDIHPLARDFMAQNLALNGLAPMRFHRGDWQGGDAELGRFGLLMGSDVLYERNHAGDLSAFVDRHAASDSEVIIVDPNRGHRSEFRRAMEHLAFDSEVVRAPAGGYDGVAFKGQILTFKRCPARVF